MNEGVFGNYMELSRLKVKRQKRKPKKRVHFVFFGWFVLLSRVLVQRGIRVW